jgi:hypothetical protein
VDDFGNEMEITDESNFQLSPKGFFASLFILDGYSLEEADEKWALFESFCVKRLDRGEEYAALIFDGTGGVIVGAAMGSECDE